MGLIRIWFGHTRPIRISTISNLMKGKYFYYLQSDVEFLIVLFFVFCFYFILFFFHVTELQNLSSCLIKKKKISNIFHFYLKAILFILGIRYFVQNKNLKANANGNRTFSTFKQGLKMTVQNGPVEERLHSATAAVVISMEPLMREALVKNNNC